MFVKPVTGRLVRCPVRGEFLPESGAEVPDTLFWHRRLKDGDVCLSPPVTENKLVKKPSQENE
ncbi:DUF2635 domain-containing protein [Xenorhabdus bovienii]|uniref:DUF2635 domain-containing protein n=1 Tax=Xenorhabdus bovienii TaxID=40576 RepID=UPI0004D669B3|nr:DUF2635 domain-containing protein [Xenorhabdus bovienii]CDG88086.1 Mu-like prophage FluMu protein gp38 [Xenorhabdus bovienii str. feltiae France]CDG91616.1 Mu-like prophage FluMu protein gp38 [Xenorhabdus bovienii str. feltiae Florida]